MFAQYKWYRFFYPFNRTILELKQDWAQRDEKIIEAFNRTILELKLIFDYHRHPNINSFNRTILELKPLEIAVCNAVSAAF